MILERTQVEVGPLLAEGGEGRVYTLADRSDGLFKEYREPVPLALASALIGWPAEVARTSPGYAARVLGSAAWPTAVVTDGDAAVGVLMPRAPQAFWLHHRDGIDRLATLSYLTADPAQRAAAYGLSLPPPMAPERIAVVYALARLLVALHEASPAAGHGDLSARNVLWSLHDVPRVYLIDCDNSELADDQEVRLPGPGAVGPPGAFTPPGTRRRPMTPNWDDPSIPPGANPDLLSDRYSLALIFLRVAGAAHYPVQRRQRRREAVAVDFDLPDVARHLHSLRRGAPIWAICAAGLSLQRSARPAAATWVATLEAVLDEMGADAGTDLAGAVRRAQDGPVGVAKYPTAAAEPAGPPPAVRDVTVRPVAATARTQAWRVALSRPAEAAEELDLRSTSAQIRRQLRYSAVWWWIAHRRMVGMVVSRRSYVKGLRRLVFLAFVDVALASAALFVVAMIVSPFLGI